jgi:proline dehydrogenase
MSLMRSMLLAGSQSAWLRERAARYPFVRRSVSRFMPGETLDDALNASASLRAAGIPTILTRLGENLTSRAEADEVADHYVEVMDRVRVAGLDTQISVKPTQLGLDLDSDLCHHHVARLVDYATELGNFVWIDMESTPYVDPTLALFRRIRERSRTVGICLQAYLRRTAADVESLLPLGPAIRLVKGAYKEPPSLAFPAKHDVDENFYRLAVRLTSEEALRAGSFLAIATHDPRLVGRLRTHLASTSVPREAWEFEMLFGIQRGLQTSLARETGRIRVLISYGEYWFPWYMRRLAERPANVMFVLKNLFGG